MKTIVELINCDLEIGYIGTQSEIAILALYYSFEQIGRMISESLANMFESLGKAFCGVAKNIRAGLK